MNNLFVLTEKDLVKLSVMMLLAAIFFGLSGLVMMIILQWITRQSYAKDSVDKHGISTVSASRLGGAAVVACTVGLVALGAYNGFVNTKGAPLVLQLPVWLAIIGCMSLGLVEDLRNNYLSPSYFKKI